MRNNVVHCSLMRIQIVNGSANFLMGGLFPPPPVLGFLSVLKVLTMSAAKCKKGFLFNGIDFPTHHVKNIGRNQMRQATAPTNSFITMLQQIKILMTAIYECNGKLLFLQFPQDSLLLSGTIPDEPEISAYN